MRCSGAVMFTTVDMLHVEADMLLRYGEADRKRAATVEASTSTSSTAQDVHSTATLFPSMTNSSRPRSRSSANVRNVPRDVSVPPLLVVRRDHVPQLKVSAVFQHQLFCPFVLRHVQAV